jgi:hypothetical protein
LKSNVTPLRFVGSARLKKIKVSGAAIEAASALQQTRKKEKNAAKFCVTRKK